MSDPTVETASIRDESTLYVIVWASLVLLLVAGLAIFVLPIPRELAIALIFTVAAIKAGLVLRNYMHLKHEHLLIYIIVLVPALFLLGFALTLIPDIVFRHAR
jgi:caa(3)-type oxidase subunit IV